MRNDFSHHKCKNKLMEGEIDNRKEDIDELNAKQVEWRRNRMQKKEHVGARL